MPPPGASSSRPRVLPSQLPSRWLRRGLEALAARQRQDQRLLRLNPHLLAVVNDLERLPLEQPVLSALVRERDAQPPPPIGDAESHPPQPGGQRRRELQPLAVVAQPAEASDRRQPGPPCRGEMDPLLGVAREVLEIQERALGEQPLRQLDGRP